MSVWYFCLEKQLFTINVVAEFFFQPLINCLTFSDIYFNATLNSTWNHVKVISSVRRVIILAEDYCNISICLHNSQAYQWIVTLQVYNLLLAVLGYGFTEVITTVPRSAQFAVNPYQALSRVSFKILWYWCKYDHWALQLIKKLYFFVTSQ